MARIEIDDLEKDEEISEGEMKSVMGGYKAAIPSSNWQEDEKYIPSSNWQSTGFPGSQW